MMSSFIFIFYMEKLEASIRGNALNKFPRVIVCKTEKNYIYSSLVSHHVFG